MKIKNSVIQSRAYYFALAFCVVAACAEAQETTVFRSKSGSKYHKENCRTLRNKPSPISLKDAVNAGLGPCSVCNPAAVSGAVKVVKTNTADDGKIYRVNTANVRSFADADFSKMLFAKVIRHVDGDTVHIEFEGTPPPPLQKIEKIRMIGVDTPETVHPTRGAEAFGKEASDWTKKELLGKRVAIALDWDTRDKYGRLLAYIYTSPGHCHNAGLIAQGYGHAYTRFPFQFLDEFRALETTARDGRRGLWGME